MKLLAMAALTIFSFTCGQSTCLNMKSDEVLVLYENNTIIACSTFLSCMVEKICNNRVRLIKRDTYKIMNALVPEELQDVKFKKRMVRETYHRSRRQIADECCRQPCAITEFLLYCPLDAKIYEDFPLDRRPR